MSAFAKPTRRAVGVPEKEGDELRLFGAPVLGRVLVGVGERARQRVVEDVRAV